MARDHHSDLLAFLTVAREGSFTRAAAKLGVSPSALSHTLRGLEARLGIRLLNRTTRSVTPTDAGKRLLDGIGPGFDEIEAAVSGLSELREKPAGTIRINSLEPAIDAILWPKLAKLLRAHPDIRVELVADQNLTDIVAEGFDAGVRLGEQVARDMIAVPIGPPLRMAVVGAPSYLAERGVPKTPQDLTAHDCINLRFMRQGGLYAWEFERDGRTINVRVEGRLTFNTPRHIVQAALDGFGLACLPDDIVKPELRSRHLRRVLGDWCPPFPGYHLYYPSRRQSSPAFQLLVKALRWPQR
ncbi:LysR family transcriptional regulator [Thermomonas brevis]|uniref:LysR family transcriptional regulator n=1 Tax=Thermomonas brevis TaxID=215691 RepID=A0A7G9QU43_9GAMM|nr:LysR family transcriptional regulator [Thermomonas brevis]QNN46868.1 LysR family transcriptional regulator [Thermomonas brevis]